MNDIRKGQARKNEIAMIDGYRAYCADQPVKINPYKRKTIEWTFWKSGFLWAKKLDKKGGMPNGYKRIPTERYLKEHNK